jgi:hypothetical protein
MDTTASASYNHQVISAKSDRLAENSSAENRNHYEIR